MRTLRFIPAYLLSLFAALFALVVWTTAAPAASDQEPPFRPAAADAWPSHQAIGKVTFAAVRYETDDDLRPIFGKTNPNEYGILPVLLIIDNKGGQNLLMSQMQIQLMAPGGVRLDPTPASDLPYIIAPKRPGPGGRMPVPIPLPKKKNPLAAPEFDSRAWGARNLVGNESAHGFYYFQTAWQRGAYLYISGIKEAGSGKELFYAEVPIDGPGDAKGPAAEGH
jgi:hypothetical protein